MTASSAPLQPSMLSTLATHRERCPAAFLHMRKYTRRRQSAPSTVFGRAMTVGEELSIIKEYNESQAKKKQSKEQRAVVRERKQREKVVSEHKDLHEANVILKKCHTRIEVKKSL